MLPGKEILKVLDILYGDSSVGHPSVCVYVDKIIEFLSRLMEHIWSNRCVGICDTHLQNV